MYTLRMFLRIPENVHVCLHVSTVMVLTSTELCVYGQESKSAERYVRQGNVLPMATRIKISEIVFNERPVSIF